MDQIEHGPAVLPEAAQRQPEQDRQQQHLQNLALREGAHKCLGDQVQQEVHRAHLFRGGRVFGQPTWIQLGRVRMKTCSRREHIRDDEPDDEGERRDHLEVDERLRPHPPDLLQVADSRQSHDNRCEDNRPDQHLHHAHKRIPERPKLHPPRGLEEADQPTDHNAGEDLQI